MVVPGRLSRPDDSQRINLCRPKTSSCQLPGSVGAKLPALTQTFKILDALPLQGQQPNVQSLIYYGPGAVHPA